MPHRGSEHDYRPSGWPYHQRDLDGAWQALDDLRRRFDELLVRLELEHQLRQAILDDRKRVLSTTQRILIITATSIAIGSAVWTALHSH